MAHIREPEVRPLADQPTNLPTRKVSAGAFVGAVVTLAVAVASALDVTIEQEVVAAAGTVATFAVQYFVRDRL